MVNNHEVEIRVILKGAEYSRVKNILDSSAGKGLVSSIKDLYFCPVSVKSFKEIEMDSVGSYSLRLRTEQVENNTSNDINVKVITSFGDHNAWDEHETNISSIAEMEVILQAIGFKIFFVLDKQRTVYKYKEISVCLEKIKGFGVAIELEIITSTHNRKEAKEKLIDLLAVLKIDKKQIVKKSVTNLIMKTQSKF